MNTGVSVGIKTIDCIRRHVCACTRGYRCCRWRRLRARGFGWPRKGALRRSSGHDFASIEGVRQPASDQAAASASRGTRIEIRCQGTGKGGRASLESEDEGVLVRLRRTAGRCPPIVDPACLRSCFAVACRQAARTAWSNENREGAKNHGSGLHGRRLLQISNRAILSCLKRRVSQRAQVCRADLQQLEEKGRS